jgi:hypothetical protein
VNTGIRAMDNEVYIFLNPMILFVSRLKTSTYNIPENKRMTPNRIDAIFPYDNNRIKKRII